MEHIIQLINALADALKGHNALIQVQVGSQYLIRKVGDINRLAGKRLELSPHGTIKVPWGLNSMVMRLSLSLMSYISSRMPRWALMVLEDVHPCAKYLSQRI